METLAETRPEPAAAPTALRVRRLVLPIAGMTCAACAARLERVLGRLPGVAAARVNLATERAELLLADPPASPAELVEAVRSAGYGVRERTSRLVIGGMSCASCVGRVERALAAVPGVLEASVNLASERAEVRHLADPAIPAALVAAVREAGYRAVLEGGRGLEAERAAAAERAARRREAVALVLAVLLTVPLVLPMLAALLGLHLHPSPWLELALATPVQFLLGARFYRDAWAGLRAGTGNMSLLVALGTSAAYLHGLGLVLLEGEAARGRLFLEGAAVVITMVRLGRWLEARAKASAAAALRELTALAPETARVLRAGREVELPVEEVAVGDRLVIRPGERVPVDARILDGVSELDESLLTGESLPVRKGPGDRVIAGSINGSGLLRCVAERVGSDTTLARITELVERAQAGKAPIQRLVDRVSAVFVPAVVAFAALVFLAWLAAGGGLDRALPAAVAVLVIACPCALGLATPAALVAGTGAAARAGILIRDIATLERAHAVDLVAFDKTGTLTIGRPELVALHPLGRSEESLLRLVAAAQQGSEHPLGRAILRAASERGLALPPVETFEARPGFGLVARVEGRVIRIGRAELLQEVGIATAPLGERARSEAAAGRSLAWVAIDGELAGLLALEDALRPEAAEAVAALHRRGLTTALLSGDLRATAERVARTVGIPRVEAPLLPAEKVAAIERFRAEGRVVAMVGDGVNDAPALAAADVGVAMGGGADAAHAAAGLTLLRPDPRLVAAALEIAAATRRTIRQNLAWAFLYNLLGLPVAALGLLSPALAGTAMALSSVSVVANALRLRRWRPARDGSG